ncbi:methyltransferase-like protein 1-like, partial [Trifolium medium]|nr:methyltransferase-like protein 1-like [Trifolium medium]
MGRNAHRGSGGSKEDFRYSEKSENGRESRDKSRGSSEQVKSSRRKRDEVDIVSVKKGQDSVSEKGDLKSGKVSDAKRSESRERSESARSEPGESRVSGSDNKVVKSGSKEDRRSDSERGKSKGKLE